MFLKNKQFIDLYNKIQILIENDFTSKQESLIHLNKNKLNKIITLKKPQSLYEPLKPMLFKNSLKTTSFISTVSLENKLMLSLAQLQHKSL